MTTYEGNEGRTRDDLVQRVALMEAMVAEGRRATTRYGWMFLLWGLVYFAAMGWMVFLPAPNLAWPVCIAVGVAIVVAVKTRQKRRGAVDNLRSRSIEAVWTVMGVAVTLFVIATMGSHQTSGTAYVAAILFMVGMAHGTSAMILRWGVQGLAAAIWWGCGIATLFYTSAMESIALFLTASFFGMVLFGLYAMLLERRGEATVQRHA
jgi:hypothetical protein